MGEFEDIRKASNAKYDSELDMEAAFALRHRKTGMSTRKIATLMGLPESTVRRRLKRAAALNPAEQKPPTTPQDSASDSEHSATSPTPAATDDKATIKQLEAKLALQQERIDNLSSSKFSLPAAASHITPSSDAYYRVIIPDTHGCFVDDKALSAFLYDLEQLAPSVREIVMLGDHVDCGGFLAQHHTIGYVAEANYTFEDDINATNQLLDKLQATCPKATIHYLEGNHERRVEKWIVTQVLKSQQDANFLKKHFGIKPLLNIEKRGINYYEQGKFYDNIAIPATIRLGRCYFTHGSRTGKHAAKMMLDDFGGNIVFGHVHRADSYTSRTVQEGVIGSWVPGCLCRTQPLWNHTQITGWSHGYGLQLVRPDEDFLHINVPIINGKSYLVQLTSQARAGSVGSESKKKEEDLAGREGAWATAC